MIVAYRLNVHSSNIHFAGNCGFPRIVTRKKGEVTLFSNCERLIDIKRGLIGLNLEFVVRNLCEDWNGILNLNGFDCMSTAFAAKRHRKNQILAQN